MPASSAPRRLWPAALLVVGLALALGAIWLLPSGDGDAIRQDKVSRTAGLLAGGALALFAWVLLSSRVRRARKLQTVAVASASVVAFFALFEYRGVSGDLVPQFELRFRTSATDLADTPLSALPGAADFPQFLGPSRDGRLGGPTLARDWSASPPRVLWRRPVGRGWSGFAVSGNTAVTHEQHGAEERVVAYELSTGKVLWASREVAHYENALAGEGPRATPAIDGGRVYAMGGTGLLTALALDDGELLWKRDVLKDTGASLPTWGKSGSPLVLDRETVVVSGGEGSALVAYAVESGEIVWRGGSEAAAYSSPALLEIDGMQQLVSLNHASVTGHDPATGRVLWSQPWPSAQPSVSQPLLVEDDRLLVSAGYGVGSKLFRIRKEGTGSFAPELLWESVRLKSKFANLIAHEGHVYGLDDGILVCMDPATGRRLWKGGRYGHGQLLLVGDLLLVQGEHGEIVLVDPGPEKLVELARFPVMDQKVWNPPALAGRYLLVRNDAEAALVELPLEP